ncbi:NlpC/P60 family protein [Shewanella psychrophila]|uniref:NlpC/P60 family protein n=1 Tax=Shewanella psychrophila TaxID=225848 RepID=A0A1S6HYS0_9GAMM|nr:NlpC/P60 family protein [Shewanella psychrophila]AQS40683.1 NlpC/P60 family protein [Shewanella psychrophila]
MFRPIFILVILLLLFMSGCSSQLPEQVEAGTSTNIATTKTKTSGQDSVKIKEQLLKQRLMAFHSEWKGTPYRYGGMSKHGVDCSALVYLAYKDILGKKLPRTTADQKNLGSKVSKGNLKIGDLVFFKTGWSTRHVGIYLGHSKFLHASTSQGVMISTLNNSYWKRKYWLSRSL